MSLLITAAQRDTQNMFVYAITYFIYISEKHNILHIGTDTLV